MSVNLYRYVNMLTDLERLTAELYCYLSDSIVQLYHV